jgi:hypothetical protein
MRSVGLGLALLASVQLVVLPAFAADPSQPPGKAAVTKSKKKKKAKGTQVVVTTSGEVPAQAQSNSAAPADATTPPPATTTTTTTTPATEPAPAPATPAPANPPGTVIVHINSSKSVTLEKRADAHSPWEHVCNSPCDVATPTGAQYHIVGTDLNGSRPFLIDASLGDRITLDVTPGIHNKAVTGGWILAGGIALTVGGLVTLFAGSKSGYVLGDNGTSPSTSNTDFIFTGSLLITAGVILGFTGGAFMYDNTHTKVEGAVGATPDKSSDPKGQVQVTAWRLPQWHEDSGPQLGMARSVSLFQGTF